MFAVANLKTCLNIYLLRYTAAGLAQKTFTLILNLFNQCIHTIFSMNTSLSIMPELIIQFILDILVNSWLSTSFQFSLFSCKVLGISNKR